MTEPIIIFWDSVCARYELLEPDREPSIGNQLDVLHGDLAIPFLHGLNSRGHIHDRLFDRAYRFQIAALQPASNASAMSFPVAVGGAEATHQGLSNSNPEKMRFQ